MKKIVYTSVVCSALIFSNYAMADEFKDLRQSSANMSKEQAKEVEAGRISPQVARQIIKIVRETTRGRVLHKAPPKTIKK